MQIKEKFKHLSAFLVGEPKQFLIVAGNTYCVRDGCEECPYFNKGCESKKEIVSTAIIPPARRAIGLEEKPFLILRLLPGKEFRKLREGEENPNVVPVELWNHPRDDHSLDERNLHFILSDRNKAFRVLKGQFRFYGEVSEFANSEYAKYFQIDSVYEPKHHLVAFDFSAIEPRGSAIASREANWIQIYEGKPKVVVKRIQPLQPLTGKETSIYIHKNDIFCILLGDLDKATFEKQCERCQIPCKVLQEYKKNVPGDFHALNAKAFFSGEPDWPDLKEGELPTAIQAEILSKYRNISKICGLASVYGAHARTLAKNMNCSEQEAQRRLDNFFSALPSAKKHMLHTEQRILTTGISRNFFGRIWDVSKWAFSKAPTNKERKKDIGYAIRIGYNHPIQSSMAEILKISMLRINEQIYAEKWNPLYGRGVPQNISTYTYQDIHCTTLLSIHDELDFLLLSDKFDFLIPSIYKTLQVNDIIKSLGVDFTLEMDVEYDLTRSFTSACKYPAAKIHLLNTVIPFIAHSKNIQPNLMVIDFEKIKKNFQDLLNFLQKNSDIYKEGRNFYVGIRNNKDLFLFPSKISEEAAKNLPGEKWQKAYFSEKYQ